MPDILQVPTHIISGFLGVGKTTAVIDLFRQKPATEKWAILVNEFGKMGIDRHIYQSQGITVREIPGGCMCCAQGVSLQVAINHLLREARPDRLIIESSGVGHPQGVLDTLQGEGFSQSLNVKAGICLIDPEHLLIEKYRNNDLFQQQIRLADVLVANKTDLACSKAIQAFKQLSSSFQPAKQKVATTTQGRMELDWLKFSHQKTPTQFRFQSVEEFDSQPIWQTWSFEFEESVQFDIDAIKEWMDSIQVLRMKGLIQSYGKYYLLNYANSFYEVTEVGELDVFEKRNYIEIIADDLNVKALEQELIKCQSDQQKYK